MAITYSNIAGQLRMMGRVMRLQFGYQTAHVVAKPFQRIYGRAI